MTDSDGSSSSGESEEFIKFRAAMKQIVRVKKMDIVEDLPKMFRERKAVKRAAAKSRKPKRKPDA